ncbi:hypothetical protein C2E31_03520 [Rhodopirellula baltica]|nr:hypothetical protein C2E31_03520 [Rhodopirellula baltica]
MSCESLTQMPLWSHENKTTNEVRQFDRSCRAFLYARNARTAKCQPSVSLISFSRGFTRHGQP